ncbi:class I adenylate-forming enzyme family protein [Amycolatopsis magusensis]|uniref:class I adenylate-forming enzyme family protein n=1 Tax=Amycolatopsis magusensis TaxID=882444 RepID=UPI0037ABBC8A
MTDLYPQAMLDSLAADPDSPAFEHGTRVVSRLEVLDLVARFTGGLSAAGLGRGDGVAIATAVTPEGFAAQLAAAALGCRVVGVRPGLTEAQLPHVVGRDVAALVADDPGPDLLAAADGVRVLRIGPELLSTAETPVARGRADDIASVTFTSGSTGAPKGVALTYAAMTEHWSWQPAKWSADTAELAAGYGRFLLFGTLTSAVMQEHLGLCLLSGGTAVIPEGPPDFPEVLERLRITASLLTVPRLHQLLDVLPSTEVDLSALRVLLVAGSPLAPHRMAEAFDRFGPAVRQGYGLTEVGFLTSLTADDVAAWPPALRSVGRPRAEVDLEVRDEDGNAVPTGTTGEIWVRTAYVLAGYWRNEEETADLIRDGWVRTRDLGHLDERGYLHLTGRARDVIIVNAIVHYAGAIERTLAGHPGVREAYVAGAPDERTGEAAHAFVVVDGEPDLDGLRARVARELGEAAVPATITVVDGVPTLPSGKPDKRALLTLR